MEQKKFEEAEHYFGFEKRFEEAERICGWREMQPGYWYFVSKEVRGMNKWQKPITVVEPRRTINQVLCATFTTLWA